MTEFTIACIDAHGASYVIYDGTYRRGKVSRAYCRYPSLVSEEYLEDIQQPNTNVTDPAGWEGTSCDS